MNRSWRIALVSLGASIVILIGVPGAPAFADHTREVLAEAGLAGDAIDKLVADGVARDGGDPDAPR